MMAVQHARQDWQILGYVYALYAITLKAEQLAGGLVCQKHPAGLVDGENSQGAGLDEDAHLRLGVLAEPYLRFELPQIFVQQPASLDQLGGKEPRQCESGQDHEQSVGRPGRPPQRSKKLLQEAAEPRQGYNLEPAQHSR